MSARELLVQLGDRRVRVWAEGNRLRYKGPKGAITSDIRGALLRQKAGLLKLLGRADEYLALTLRQFEDARCSLEVQIPGLTETVWFVSGQEEVHLLRGEGVPVGRIWTAAELRMLSNAPGVTHEDALAITRAKIATNAEVVESRPDDRPPAAVDSATSSIEPEPPTLDLDPPPVEHER